MSIYYNHSQNVPPKLHSNNRSPNQSHHKLQPIVSPSRERVSFNQKQDSKSPKQRVNLSLIEKKQEQMQWQDIGYIQKREQKQIFPKQQSMVDKQKQRKKSPARMGLRGTLATIVNYYEEQESVAEITHYQVFSDKEDQLSESNSTVQSNDRNKYTPLPRKQQEPLKNTQQGRPLARNTQLNAKDEMQNEQLALRQRQSLEKSKPRYLFYKVIQEQREEPQKKNIKDSKPLLQKNNQSPKKSQKRKDPSRLVSQNDYEYVKDVHAPNQNKKMRLKNKLGFICDIFQRADEAASVSYYSQSQNSNKQSMEMIKKEPSPQNKRQEKQQDQNIFHPNQRQQQQYEQIHQNQARSIINIKVPSQQPSKKSNQFQQSNVKQPKQSPPKQDYRLMPDDSSFLKIKKSIKVNKSLEKIQLQMAQINRNRSRSKLSATKSVENKPKAPRYNEIDEDQIPNEENRPKKQSVDLRDLSRHIKKSINRQSSSKQTPVDQLMKSKSASSKFSIKLMEMQLQKSSQRQQKSISQGKAETPKQNSQKKSKQQQVFEQETTIKKPFPIARKQSLPKNNGNFSKYMKINFKEDDQINQNEEKQQIPSIIIKNNHAIQRSKHIFSIQKQPIKINSNTNTNQQTSKISFKPVNRVEFNIDRTKRINTQSIQPKEELSEQQKKFLALLKKRQDALLKRVKEQVINNNPTSMLRDNIQQKSKGTSNQTFQKILSKQQSSSNKPKNYYQAQRRQKMSLIYDHQNEVQMKSYFPTLNMSPTSKQQYQTFYNNPLKRTNSKKTNYILSSKKKGFSQHLSSDSQRGKTLEDRFQDMKNYKKQPSKISYYNIKKFHKEASLNQKNMNSKEKYERLKQLLQQI